MVEDSTPAAATCSSTPALAITTSKNCSVLQAKITEYEHEIPVMKGTTLGIIVLFCA